MKNQQFISRRGTGNYVSGGTWNRNQNTVRYVPKMLGSFSYAVVLLGIVMIFGIFYVTQSTKVSKYDYELSGIDAEIAELAAKKEDLAVEQARLTSAVAAERAGKTMAMTEAPVAQYINE